MLRESKRTQFAVSLLLALGFFLAGSSAFADKQQDALDKKLENFWSHERKIKVIQRRSFTKDGRLALVPYLGVIPNDDFQTYITAGLRIEYYFDESWSLEITAAKAFGIADSSLMDFLQTRFGASTTVPQKLYANFNLNGVWTPFYGKIGFLSTKLLHFDFNLSVGISGMLTRLTPEKDPNNKQWKFLPAGNFGVGVRLHILNWFGIRIDYRQYFHHNSAKGGISFPAEISLGFNFFVIPPKR